MLWGAAVSIGRSRSHRARPTIGWLMTVGVSLRHRSLSLLAPHGAGRSAPKSRLGRRQRRRLTGIDVIYVARQVVAPIYLVDAAAEVFLIAAGVRSGSCIAGRRRGASATAS